MKPEETGCPTIETDQAPTKLGAVFTKTWVVELILDLAGYLPDTDLCETLVIEPAVGHGAFAAPIARRILESTRIHGRHLKDAGDAMRCFDIDERAVNKSRQVVAAALEDEGVDPLLALHMVSLWIHKADFLASAKELGMADWVIGNPPYVRIEDVDRILMSSYRKSWPTMTGRADLYVGFIEASISLLAPGGRLAFICADRWMRNQYGGALRKKVGDSGISMDTSLTMHDTSAFEKEVSAYPAITVMRKGLQGPTFVCSASRDFGEDSAHRLLQVWSSGAASPASESSFSASWTDSWFTGEASWPDAEPATLAMLAHLESAYPSLTETGASISIGIATGADRVFITNRAANTESDRLVKIVGARETAEGRIAWAGRFLVNPWGDEGLLALGDRPGMAAYFRRHARILKARHVAAKNPKVWWRTIDRVHPELLTSDKLLIPDLRDRIDPVLDRGGYVPGHSLYYITSDTWDLEVLGGLLISDIAAMFVEAYSVRMANGYMRVSAQYLRRIRAPRPESLSVDVREGLRAAFLARDTRSASHYSRRAYGLT